MLVTHAACTLPAATLIRAPEEKAWRLIEFNSVPVRSPLSRSGPMACRHRQLPGLDAGRLRFLRGGFSGGHAGAPLPRHQERHRVDHDRDPGHASGGRDRLRIARRPLRTPQAAHGERGFLFRGRTAVRICSQLHRVSDSAHASMASGWAANGASERRLPWKARRQSGAEFCPASCRADIPSAICWRPWRRVSFCPLWDGAPCSGWAARRHCWRFYIRFRVRESEAWKQHRAPTVRCDSAHRQRSLEDFSLPRPADDAHDVSLARHPGPLSRLPEDGARIRSESRGLSGDHIQHGRGAGSDPVRTSLGKLRPPPQHDSGPALVLWR